MNNITIIPGSYKPPHKGHLSLIERLIKKKNNKKIIIVISKKPRTLDENFLNINIKKKEYLKNALIKYFPLEKEEILLLSKKDIIIKINNLIKNNLLKSINDEKSYKIWNIYLKYLKKKYNNIYFPKIILRKCENNNIISETNKLILELFRKEKAKNIILMKSTKNANNTRFKSLEDRYSKYIKVELFPNIKNIEATDLRKYILNNDKENFIKYLPKDLDIKDINKIWNICNKNI
jgi:nicotinamide mononucleotide adenylyltransferase